MLREANLVRRLVLFHCPHASALADAQHVHQCLRHVFRSAISDVFFQLFLRANFILHSLYLEKADV